MADIYFFDRRDYDKAREYYELTLKYTLEEKNTQRLLSLLHLCIGHCYYFKKEFVQAIECAEKSLKTKYSTEAEYQLAQYCALNGEKDKALSHLKSVLNSDRKYVFRVLQEPDFVSIKKEIQQLLIWLKRIRDLWNLKLKIIELEKNTGQEIEKNKQLGMDPGILERWPSILDKARKTIDGLDEEFKNDSHYSLSWVKKSQSCQRSIYRIRSLIRALHALLKSSKFQRQEKEKQEDERRKKEEKQRAIERQRRSEEDERRRKAEEQKEKERQRLAQEEQKIIEQEVKKKAEQKAKRLAEIKKIETEVKNYRKDLAKNEKGFASLATNKTACLITTIVMFAVGGILFYYLITFDSKKNEIEVAQKYNEWQRAKGFWDMFTGNSDNIYSEYVNLRNRKLYLFLLTAGLMLMGSLCLACFIGLSTTETKELLLLRDELNGKKNYIEKCKEWLKKQT